MEPASRSSHTFVMAIRMDTGGWQLCSCKTPLHSSPDPRGPGCKPRLRIGGTCISPSSPITDCADWSLGRKQGAPEGGYTEHSA